MGCHLDRGINHLVPHSSLLTLYTSLLQSAALDGQQVDGTATLHPQTHLRRFCLGVSHIVAPA